MLLGSRGSRFDRIDEDFTGQVLDNEALVAGLLFNVHPGLLLISVNAKKSHDIENRMIVLYC